MRLERIEERREAERANESVGAGGREERVASAVASNGVELRGSDGGGGGGGARVSRGQRTDFSANKFRF